MTKKSLIHINMFWSGENFLLLYHLTSLSSCLFINLFFNLKKLINALYEILRFVILKCSGITVHYSLHMLCPWLAWDSRYCSIGVLRYDSTSIWSMCYVLDLHVFSKHFWRWLEGIKATSSSRSVQSVFGYTYTICHLDYCYHEKC